MILCIHVGQTVGLETIAFPRVCRANVVPIRHWDFHFRSVLSNLSSRETKNHKIPIAKEVTVTVDCTLRKETVCIFGSMS